MLDRHAGTPSTRGRRTGLLPRAAALLGAGLLLAACGSSEPATGGSGNSGNSGAAGVDTREHPQLGTILTDSSGDTLYFAEQEAGGKIQCKEGCLSIWVPMTMPGDAPPAGEVEGLGVIRRDDNGQNQLTWQGKPLYTFTLDKKPGDISGDNVADDFSGVHFVWHAAALNAQPGGGTESPMTTTSGGYGY